MSEIRPFARYDRDGLAAVVNRHVAAVLPGGAIPVATLLSQLERDASEPITDPWVVARHTVVGLDTGRVVAAAYLRRFGTDPRVSSQYNDAGEIEWLVFDPERRSVAEALLSSALTTLKEWGTRIWYADGNLPCVGVYGVPDAWPHVQQLLLDAGFSDADGQSELIFAGDLAAVEPPATSTLEGLELRRVVGPLGVSFEAVLDGEVIGAFEVEDSYGISNDQLSSWADEANHWVATGHRGKGIGSWLFRHGCQWLRLGGKARLLAYCIESPGARQDHADVGASDCEHYYERFGMHQIARTRRGWQRQPLP